MPIDNILSDFRNRFRECYAVAFADISTSMVLATSASKHLDQEFWDGMAERAVLHLNTGISDSIAECLNPGTTNKLTFAIFTDNSNCQVFMRSSLDPEFAICSMIDKKTNFEEFFPASKMLADQLTQNA